MEKSFYLGSVDAEHVKKEKNFDVNKLLTLENNDAVVNIMCNNCHSVVEGTMAAAVSLAQAANVDLPENLSDKYFLTSCCLLCDQSDNEVSVELKGIKQFVN